MRTILVVSFALALGSTSGLAQTKILTEKTTEIPKVAEHEARVFSVDFPAGTSGTWHTHPAPVLIYVERGTLTSETEGEQPKEIKAGQALMDSANKKHRMSNKGGEAVRLIVFQLSDPSKPLHEHAGH
jgi:quercetin dioxygenase-like cupin family protein